VIPPSRPHDHEVFRMSNQTGGQCGWQGCHESATTTTVWPNGADARHCQEHDDIVLESLRPDVSRPETDVRRLDVERLAQALLATAGEDWTVRPRARAIAAEYDRLVESRPSDGLAEALERAEAEHTHKPVVGAGVAPYCADCGETLAESGPSDELAAALRDARDYIEAQNRLLVAYRLGGRTPEKALDTLERLANVPARLADLADVTAKNAAKDPE
jgi:hypothetical protein